MPLSHVNGKTFFSPCNPRTFEAGKALAPQSKAGRGPWFEFVDRPAVGTTLSCDDLETLFKTLSTNPQFALFFLYEIILKRLRRRGRFNFFSTTLAEFRYCHHLLTDSGQLD